MRVNLDYLSLRDLDLDLDFDTGLDQILMFVGASLPITWQTGEHPAKDHVKVQVEDQVQV